MQSPLVKIVNFERATVQQSAVLQKTKNVESFQLPSHLISTVTYSYQDDAASGNFGLLDDALIDLASECVLLLLIKPPDFIVRDITAYVEESKDYFQPFTAWYIQVIEEQKLMIRTFNERLRGFTSVPVQLASVSAALAAVSALPVSSVNRQQSSQHRQHREHPTRDEPMEEDVTMSTSGQTAASTTFGQSDRASAASNMPSSSAVALSSLPKTSGTSVASTSSGYSSSSSSSHATSATSTQAPVADPAPPTTPAHVPASSSQAPTPASTQAPASIIQSSSVISNTSSSSNPRHFISAEKDEEEQLDYDDYEDEERVGDQQYQQSPSYSPRVGDGDDSGDERDDEDHPAEAENDENQSSEEYDPECDSMHEYSPEEVETRFAYTPTPKSYITTAAGSFATPLTSSARKGERILRDKPPLFIVYSSRDRSISEAARLMCEYFTAYNLNISEDIIVVNVNNQPYEGLLSPSQMAACVKQNTDFDVFARQVYSVPTRRYIVHCFLKGCYKENSQLFRTGKKAPKDNQMIVFHLDTTSDQSRAEAQNIAMKLNWSRLTRPVQAFKDASLPSQSEAVFPSLYAELSSLMLS